MNTFEHILAAYSKQVQLPWAADTPPTDRVWVVWYDKSLQRRFTGLLGEFEQVTLKAGHGWRQRSLSKWFGTWIEHHEFFDPLVQQPEELRGLFPEIEDSLVDELKDTLSSCTANDILAIDGCGAMFGITRVSNLITRVADFIPGRLLVGFPGTHSAGVYRLLDARDGWNYHAIPIPGDSAF